MSPKIILALLCIAVTGTQAFRQWTNLKVTYNLLPRFKYYYDTMPRVASNINSNDFASISNGDCTNGGQYFGYRYVATDDYGMALLFDTQGTIAGIQQILNKDEIVVNNSYAFDQVPMYVSDNVNGRDVYVITAYFVDPQSICTTGRSSSDLSSSGTGTLLTVQNGPTPSDLVVMPRARTDAIAQGWSKNNCFPGMGFHNFYQVEQMAATNCTQTRPLFGLYDSSGDMIGFGFAATGTSNSQHFEHPPANAIKMIVGSTVPQCLLDESTAPGLSTMHVYFNDYPYLFVCPLSAVLSQVFSG